MSDAAKAIPTKTSEEILSDSENRLKEAQNAVIKFNRNAPAPPPPSPPPVQLPPSPPPPPPPYPYPYQQQQQQQQQWQPPVPQQQNPQFNNQYPQGYEFPTLTVLENLHSLLERYNHIPGVYPEGLRQATMMEIAKLQLYQQKLRGIPNETRNMVDSVFSQVIMPFLKGE